MKRARVTSLHTGQACPVWSAAGPGALPVVTFPDGTRAVVRPVPSLLALQPGHTYVRVQQGMPCTRVTGTGILRRAYRHGGRFFLDLVCADGAWWGAVPYDGAEGYQWYAVAYRLGPVVVASEL